MLFKKIMPFSVVKFSKYRMSPAHYIGCGRGFAAATIHDDDHHDYDDDHHHDHDDDHHDDDHNDDFHINNFHIR